MFGVAGCLSSGFNFFIVLTFVSAAFAITFKSELFSILTSSYLSGLFLGILSAVISYFLLRPLVATYQKKRSALKAKRFKKKLMRKRYEAR